MKQTLNYCIICLVKQRRFNNRLLSPYNQIPTHSNSDIPTARIAISSLQAKSPAFLFRNDGMVDVIRHSLIHVSWEYLQAVQSRTIPTYPCPVKTILIVCLFTVNDRITNPNGIFQSNQQQRCHRWGYKQSINLYNSLYLRLGTYFCRQRLVRTEPNRHTNHNQQYN